MSAARTRLDVDDMSERELRFGDHPCPPPALEPGPLVVELTSPGPEWRGRLGRWIDHEVTRALSAPNAPPARATFEPEADPHTLVGRALSLGATHLVVRLGSLRSVATVDGLLGVSDSASLRRWAAAALERPLSLELSAADASLLGYAAPRPLAELLGPSTPESAPTLPPSPKPATLRRSAPPPAPAQRVALAQPAAAVPSPATAQPATPSPSSAPAQLVATSLVAAQPEAISLITAHLEAIALASVQPAATALGSVQPEAPSLGTAQPEAPSPDAAVPANAPDGAGAANAISAVALADAVNASGPADSASAARPADAVNAARPADASDVAGPANAFDAARPLGVPAPGPAEPAGTPSLASAPRSAAAQPRRALSAAAPRPLVAKVPPTRLFPGLDEAGARACAAELEAARGPHSLAQIEQLFVRRYLPLAEAEAFGIADAQARRARAQWAAAFSRTYTESFATFRPAGKRPTMVLDAPAIAGRAARLHGARTTQLFLVDGLRFDLGLRVHKRLGELLRGHAVCAERAVLWSALPSTTPTQLALLARGPEGLALPQPETDEEPIINRGRGVDVPRRVKVGARDVLKLDLVEARLRDAAGAPSCRLDEVAEEVAQAVAKCALSLPARTLLFVFGDHGFLLDESEGRGERPNGAWQGGASPEEVLVPGFAYLTGGVH